MQYCFIKFNIVMRLQNSLMAAKGPLSHSDLSAIMKAKGGATYMGSGLDRVRSQETIFIARAKFSSADWNRDARIDPRRRKIYVTEACIRFQQRHNDYVKTVCSYQRAQRAYISICEYYIPSICSSGKTFLVKVLKSVFV